MMDFVMAKRHYVIALAIMFVVVSLSGTTYSLFLKEDVTNEFIYNVGMLDLQFVEDEQINIQNAFPMIDSDGMKLEPYKLTIKNTGNLPYLFDLKMLSSTDENLISMKYIKYQVNDGKPNTLYNSNNIIASNVILYPEEDITFNVRVWLDISMPNVELGKMFMAKLVTNGQSIYRTLDTSGANIPDIIDGMIPVYYDEGANTWRKADKSNIIDSYRWYNYDDKEWANVVTIKNSKRKIYDITGNNDLLIDDARTNNGNYVSDMKYLDIGLGNYRYNNISNIFRIKFNNLNEDNIYIISNGNMSYYYDTINSRFVFKIGDNMVNSSVYSLESRKWYILGYTYDGSRVNFYIDGVKISSANITGSISSISSFKVATDSTFKELSNMEIGDIYIYRDILTDSEINTNYKVNVSVLYSDLVVGYNDFQPKTLWEYYNTLDLGMAINNEDVSHYYVWVPRFKYKLWNVTGSVGIDSYGAYNNGIDIVFEKDAESSGVVTCKNYVCYSDNLMISRVTNNDNGKYYTHPAFNNNESGMTGLWVSKYEISTSDSRCIDGVGDGCLSSNLIVESKLGNTSWRNNTLSNFYTNIKNIGSNYSVIKNIEWGALSYLTHSKYGLCSDDKCNDIGTNKTYISGNELGDSTTNNMYGVFDLSGSATEFVMGNYSNLDKVYFGNTLLDTDIYKNNRFILGDATREITVDGGIWYNNYNSFVDETNNWFIRGGIGSTDTNGIFYYNGTTDTNSQYITTRIVVK